MYHVEKEPSNWDPEDGVGLALKSHYYSDCMESFPAQSDILVLLNSFPLQISTKLY